MNLNSGIPYKKSLPVPGATRSFLGPPKNIPYGAALAFFGASSCPSWAAACNGVNSSNDMGFTSSRERTEKIIDFLPLDFMIFMFVPYDADADKQKVGKKLRTNQDILEAKNLMECFFVTARLISSKHD